MLVGAGQSAAQGNWGCAQLCGCGATQHKGCSSQNKVATFELPPLICLFSVFFLHIIGVALLQQQQQQQQQQQHPKHSPSPPPCSKNTMLGTKMWRSRYFMVSEHFCGLFVWLGAEKTSIDKDVKFFPYELFYKCGLAKGKTVDSTCILPPLCNVLMHRIFNPFHHLFNY